MKSEKELTTRSLVDFYNEMDSQKTTEQILFSTAGFVERFNQTLTKAKALWPDVPTIVNTQETQPIQNTKPGQLPQLAIEAPSKFAQTKLKVKDMLSALGEEPTVHAIPSLVPQVSKNRGADPRKVFVVTGRNESLRVSMFSFLRALDLNPIEFSEAIRLTGKGAPYIGEILDAAFSNAQALIVLMSPDDMARLRTEFLGANDPAYERELTGQPRQNVLFEAGMAFGYRPERTILVTVGDLRPFSDIYGRHVVRLTNDPAKRNDLLTRLRNVGCAVKTEGTDWLKVGQFEIVSPPEAEGEDETNHLIIDQPKATARIGMEAAKAIALEYVRRERPEARDAKVDSAQLVENSWEVSGYWTESGPKSFSSTNFKLNIDSQTKEILKAVFASGFAMAVG